MKDKTVLVGCSLLFCAGIVWGKLSGTGNFYKIKDIHDLFDIIGAIATCIAAYVAVSALSGWKGQFAHAEKYRLIRDFHIACKGCWSGYWYVSHGFDLIEDAWKNRNVDDWFSDTTESSRTALNESRSSLEAAFALLQHHLNKEERNFLSEKYWEFMNEVSKGCSESMFYVTQCSMLIEEPGAEKYLGYFYKRNDRLKLIEDARNGLCSAADYLLEKYAQPQ